MNTYNEENKFVELISKMPNVAIQGYNKERIVIYWNEASEKMYGYTQKEALGKKLEDLIIPDFMREDVIQGIKNWYDNNIPIPVGELSLKHKNDSTVYAFSSHIMIGKDSSNPEMFCVDIDLTEQKKQEQLLKDKDRVLIQQSKMATMGEMLENIAHQWRQPLSIISTTASGIKIQKEFGILDDKFLYNTLDSIIKHSHYLSQTIEDFRNFIKGDKNKSDFNVYNTIKYSLKLLKSVTHQNYINIILTCNDRSIKISNYSNELVQVIINLINNSRDALIEQNIENRFIFIALQSKKDTVSIKIKDNANGILEENIDKIFEEHYTTKKESKGSGIGLYMSKRLIVESIKGSISVENTEYLHNNIWFKGAQFNLELPNI